MMMRKCFACMCAGVCLCGFAVAAAVVHEFERPNQLVCENAPVEVDLGMPERCNGETLPHGRNVFTSMLAVASTSSVVSVWSGTWALSAVDAEDAAETIDRKFPHSSLPASTAITPDSDMAKRLPIYRLRDGEDPEQIG